MHKFKHCTKFCAKNVKIDSLNGVKGSNWKVDSWEGLTWCRKRFIHHRYSNHSPTRSATKTSSPSSFNESNYFSAVSPSDGSGGVSSSHYGNLMDDVNSLDTEEKALPAATTVDYETLMMTGDSMETEKASEKFPPRRHYQIGLPTEYFHNYVEACCRSGFVFEGVENLKRHDKLIENMPTVELVLKSLFEDKVGQKLKMMEGIFEAMEINRTKPSLLCYLYRIATIQQTCRTRKEERLSEVFARMEHDHGAAVSSSTDVETCIARSSTRPQRLRFFHRQACLLLGRTCDVTARDDDVVGAQEDERCRGFDEQLTTELSCFAQLPSVVAPSSSSQQQHHEDDDRLAALHQRWRFSLACHFRQKRYELKERWQMSNSVKQRNAEFSMSLVPFLYLLPDQNYIDIMLRTLEGLPLAGAVTSHVCSQLGECVYKEWVVKEADHEALGRVNARYTTLRRLHPTSLSRLLWERAERECDVMLSHERRQPWHFRWTFRVGLKLLELMVATLTVDLSKHDMVPTAYFRHTPAVYNSFKPWGRRLYSMTIPHPSYVALQARKRHVTFQSDALPMVTPVKPWCASHFGGFLVYPTRLVRKGGGYDASAEAEGADGGVSSSSSVEQVCDALNVISSVRWRINTPVLDIQLDTFRKGGDRQLGIPQPRSAAPPLPSLSLMKLAETSWKERYSIRTEYDRVKKQEKELHSLYCDGLYKFTVANHCRDRTFWLPHSLDFRGRAYPVPPHFNYMGADGNRALFRFEQAKPLGEKGLEWLKIHLINLSDMKKGESNEAKLIYADEIIDDIMDSAERPLEGRGWWKECEEKWQALAACFELAQALKSSQPHRFPSTLAIYQDGSCNGLQHYAALGRDVIGAQQVNLSPADKPQDIYSGVAANVEAFRRQDAAQGHEIARILEGFVTRKVVKQTVMTTVYGVTRYGGGQQINRQLVDIPHFPHKHAQTAANYLVLLVFRGLDVMFTGASEIKKWLQEIAEVISKGGETVDWVTPLGLHVTQPYFKTTPLRVDSQITRLSLKEEDTLKPNVLKQRNAFPPNFIHSLDATHMMLTALQCQKESISFAAVHDCYWTHACDVDAMNAACRRQFVHLHRQPILERLVEHLTERIINRPSRLDKPHLDKLKQLFDNIPQRGDFDLDEVKKSTYFFC